MRIDQEIKRFVTEAYNRALEILQANRASIEQMADELLLREVLDADQVRRIVAGQPLEEYVPAKPRRRRCRRPKTSAPRREQRPSIVPPLNKPLAPGVGQ